MLRNLGVAEWLKDGGVVTLARVHSSCGTMLQLLLGEGAAP
jgi:hypothetical protein